MLPSIADIISDKPHNSDAESVLEVNYLFTRWRQIKSQLLYAELFEGSILNRLKVWHQLQKACRFEKETYLKDRQYQVPTHILKKDLMSLFNIPSTNIVVTPPQVEKSLRQPQIENNAEEIRDSLRQNLRVLPDDVLIYMADEPNLQNGLYQALNTMKYFKEQKVAHLKLLLCDSPIASTIHKQVKELDISSRILFAEADSTQTDLLMACDIAFLPALYAPQTSALSLAMAHRRPVVLSSEVAGLETHLNLLSPYVFPLGASAPQIANCLLPLIRSSTLRHQLGERNAQALIDQTKEPIAQDHGQLVDSPVPPPKA